MKRVLLMIPLTLMLFALAACGGTTTDTTAGDDPCPTAEAGTLVYRDDTSGYCLLYPDTHQAVDPTASETVFVGGGDLMNVSDPRVSVNVTDANGLDTETAAAQMLATFGLPDTGTTGNIMLDGTDAVVLDNMPGQDLNRRVIAVHNGRLYDFMFSPVGEEYGDLGQRTEDVYRLMVESFRFLP